MPRAKNTIKTVQITVSITEQVRAFLEELTDSGLYGKNVAETANDLISERIRALRFDGELGRKPRASDAEDEQ